MTTFLNTTVTFLNWSRNPDNPGAFVTGHAYHSEETPIPEGFGSTKISFWCTDSEVLRALQVMTRRFEDGDGGFVLGPRDRSIRLAILRWENDVRTQNGRTYHQVRVFPDWGVSIVDGEQRREAVHTFGQRAAERLMQMEISGAMTDPTYDPDDEAF